MYLQSVCITSCMDRQRTPRRMNETLDYQKGEPDWFPSPARGNNTYTTPRTRGRLQRQRPSLETTFEAAPVRPQINQPYFRVPTSSSWLRLQRFRGRPLRPLSRLRRCYLRIRRKYITPFLPVRADSGRTIHIVYGRPQHPVRTLSRPPSVKTAKLRSYS